MKWAAVVASALAILLIGVQIATNRAAQGPNGDGSYEELLAYYAEFPFAGTAIGDPDAPVTVIEFFDFQCPACQTSSDVIVKPIIDKHVRAGDVYFIYRFYPILGPESVASAEAAYCAALQDAFWPYQDALFARKATGNRGLLSRNNLVRTATDLGLDKQSFEQCIASEQARNYVQSSYQYAVELGIPGTPTFFVNGVNVRTSPEAIERAIQEALAGGQ